jgi:methionine-rich copper-binding protein CopC
VYLISCLLCGATVAAAAAHQVVVDSHESAKALLDRGQLTKRVTIIPLNQVQPQASALKLTHPAADL